jgi:DNA polymerase
LSGDGLREALARYLGQQQDLGQPPVILQGLTPAEALRLAAERPGDGPGAGVSSSGGASPDAGGPSREATAPVTVPPGSSPAELPSAPLPPAELPDTLDALRDLVSVCTLCGLSGSRTQTVFSDGNPTARLMVVGEAPGANEDRTGLPFVGQAGKFLDLLLAAVNLSRAESVYICNVLKCRPPNNRDPEPQEIQACSPYLHRQIDLVRPEAILAVGTFSARLLTGSTGSLGSLRGKVHAYQGVPTVVTYHPAALLRNSSWTRATWDDLQLLRDVLDGTLH